MPRIYTSLITILRALVFLFCVHRIKTFDNETRTTSETPPTLRPFFTPRTTKIETVSRESSGGLSRESSGESSAGLSGGNTTTKRPVIVSNGNFSLYNSTLLSPGDKPFSSESLTTSPLNDKITHTIQTEFSKLFNEFPTKTEARGGERVQGRNSSDPAVGLPQGVSFEEQETVKKEFSYTPSRNVTSKQRSMTTKPKESDLRETTNEDLSPQIDVGDNLFPQSRNGGQLPQSIQTTDTNVGLTGDSNLQLKTQAFEYIGGDETFPTLEMRQTECLYSLAEDSVSWRRGSKALMIVLPHIESIPCVPPLKCKVSTTVNKKIFLQDGDSLRVTLGLPTARQSTSTSNPATSETELVDAPSEDSASIGSNSTPNEASAPLSPLQGEKNPLSENSNSTSEQQQQLAAKELIQPLEIARQRQQAEASRFSSNFIFKRSFDYDDRYLPTGGKGRDSSLTVWKVTESEWSSCSTREGGQVALSDQGGVAIIQDTDLPPGTLFFIGRSSWSSSECFKLKVIVRSANCGEGSICSGKGQCYANSTMDEFGCGCCHGYAGKHCEERDACADKPCLNSGICVDIQEGHDGSTFQCLCRYGYGGKFCEMTTSLCNSQPCRNGGYCEGNHTSYICRCAPGWTGPNCSEETRNFYPSEIEDEEDALPVDYNTRSSLSGCNESPCVHGVCIQTTQKDFKCFCQQGFGGERCELEYNECNSDPCFNGGTCVDQIGSFECLCDRGFTGPFCRIKVDLCNPDPCPMDRACIDKGNTFSCECLQGVTADDCSQESFLKEELCSPNPCANGGTCNVLADSTTPFCSCRPQYTGLTCQGIVDQNEMRFSAVNNLDQSDVLIKVSHERPDPNYGDAFVLESVGPVGTIDPARDVEIRHSPFRGPLTHMRNLYTAAVTLTCAFVIFLLVVSVCHCKMNKPYSKCFLPLPRRPNVLSSFKRIHFASLRDKKRRERLNSLRFECDPDGASVPMTSQSPAENTYYNMEGCDNQELPLIK